VEVVTVQDIQNQRADLNSTSLQENISFLSRIGYYFEQTLPSDIENTFIYETEALMNELYLKSLQEPGVSHLTDQLLDAVSQAGALAIAVNYGSFGTDFVRTVKQLGRTLIRIGRIRT
jgi:hypothetical protein